MPTALGSRTNETGKPGYSVSTALFNASFTISSYSALV